MLAQVLLGGIAQGCVLGLVALSFVLIYKTTGVLSFMQGEWLTLGAYLAWGLPHGLGWPMALAALSSITGVATLAAVLAQTVLRPRHPKDTTRMILITFGLAWIFRGAANLWSSRQYNMQTFSTPFAAFSLHWGTFVLEGTRMMVILITVLLTAILAGFFRYSRVGIGLRATAEQPLIAPLMGISVTKMHTLAWSLGAGLAGCAGILLAPLTVIEPKRGSIALLAFPAAVLGGLTHLPGALGAGLLLGVIGATTDLYLPEGIKNIIGYGFMLGTLLLFPNGLHKPTPKS